MGRQYAASNWAVGSDQKAESAAATDVGEGVACRDLVRLKVGGWDGSLVCKGSSLLRSAFSFAWRTCLDACDRLLTVLGGLAAFGDGVDLMGVTTRGSWVLPELRTSLDGSCLVLT